MGIFGTKILTQCCAITILVTILVFNAMRKKIKLRTGSNYIHMVLVTLICAVFDMLSIVFIILNGPVTETAGIFSGYLKDMSAFQVVTDIICKTYICFLVIVTGFGIRYICADMYKTEKVYKKSLRVVTIAILGEMLIIYALPIRVYYNPEDGGLYSYGLSTIATYIFVVINVVLMVYHLEKNKISVNPHRRQAVYLWVALWGLCAVIQACFPVLLIVSFGASIGVMVIYFALENPEANIDRLSGFYNKNALIQYVDQHYYKEERFSIINCSFANTSSVSKLVMNQDIYNDINAYFSALKGVEVFKISETEVALAFNERVDADDALKLIQERFAYGWGEHRNTIFFLQYIYCPDSSVCDSWELLAHAVRYAEFSLHLGNDTVYVTEELVKGMISENEMEDIIKDAIENNRVEVFYQPIYSAKKGKFCSAEALARIRREDGSIVPPGMFIPVAEKNGTIIKIGEMVFEQVCKFIQREALTERFDVDYIEVNLSIVQCAYENLADSFIGIMNANHINPSWINLEITESESLQAKDILLKNMNELILYGVSFSLDDFGTGESNLNYVMDMPVKIVKFDREMTNSYFVKDNARHIMASTIKMLREMGLEIVSEGIEEKAQLDEMLRLDVNFIQGYYFSKPLPAGDYICFLENHM